MACRFCSGLRNVIRIATPRLPFGLASPRSKDAKQKQSPSSFLRSNGKQPQSAKAKGDVSKGG
jgi:hypothetical protein